MGYDCSAFGLFSERWLVVTQQRTRTAWHTHHTPTLITNSNHTKAPPFLAAGLNGGFERLIYLCRWRKVGPLGRHFSPFLLPFSLPTLASLYLPVRGFLPSICQGNAWSLLGVRKWVKGSFGVTERRLNGRYPHWRVSAVLSPKSKDRI